MNLNLLLDQIEDEISRENFQKLQEVFSDNPWLDGSWKHYDVTIDKPSANYKFKHNLNFVPTDAIITNVSAGATVTFNYENFDITNIELDISAACKIRFLLGGVSVNRGF